LLNKRRAKLAQLQDSTEKEHTFSDDFFVGGKESQAYQQLVQLRKNGMNDENISAVELYKK